MSRDQIYGGLILLLSMIITVLYLAAFFANSISAIFPAWPAWLGWWAVAIPVFIFVLAVLGIAIWIGWTMLTTPPPAPIETIETDSINDESKE
jgi:hypothetical protein